MKFSDIELPSNRKFGLFIGAVFAFFSGYLFNRDVQNSAWILLDFRFSVCPF